MNRSEFLRKLSSYQTAYKEEQAFIARFRDLLTHPHAYFRDHFPGHMTGSAWIIDSTHEHVLLLHHVKLDRWLQPGGHADGDENIFRVAEREAFEETGLRELRWINSGIFDIDIHNIPARDTVPAHWHYDVRFLFEAEIDDTISVNGESHDVRWFHFQDLKERLANDTSMQRMTEKSIALPSR